MLTATCPAEAYRRIDFAARVTGSHPRDLTLLCYERLDAALGSALLAEQRRNMAGRSKALTEAMTVLTTLQMGLDRSNSLAAAFDNLFVGARIKLLKSVPALDVAAVQSLRQDFREVYTALKSS